MCKINTPYIFLVISWLKVVLKSYLCRFFRSELFMIVALLLTDVHRSLTAKGFSWKLICRVLGTEKVNAARPITLQITKVTTAQGNDGALELEQNTKIQS